MFVLWLGTCAITASPQLHRLLHEDAQSPEHQCLITQLQHQPLLTGFVVILVPVPPVVDVQFVCSIDFQSLSTFDYRLSPSRAPPSDFSSPTVVG
jgi:hypothetical protein